MFERIKDGFANNLSFKLNHWIIGCVEVLNFVGKIILKRYVIFLNK